MNRCSQTLENRVVLWMKTRIYSHLPKGNAADGRLTMSVAFLKTGYEEIEQEGFLSLFLQISRLLNLATYGVKLVQELHEILLKLEDDLFALKDTRNTM